MLETTIGTEVELNKIDKDRNQIKGRRTNFNTEGISDVYGFEKTHDGTVAGEWKSPVWTDIEIALLDMDKFYTEIKEKMIPNNEFPLPFSVGDNISAGQHQHIGVRNVMMNEDLARNMRKALLPVLPMLYYLHGNSTDDILHMSNRNHRLMYRSGDQYARPKKQLDTDHYNECSYSGQREDKPATLELRGFDANIPQVVCANMVLVKNLCEYSDEIKKRNINFDKYRSYRKRVASINKPKDYKKFISTYFKYMVDDINIRKLPNGIREVLILLIKDFITPFDLLSDYLESYEYDKDTRTQKIMNWFDRLTEDVTEFSVLIDDIVDVPEIPDVKYISELWEVESDDSQHIKNALVYKRGGESELDNECSKYIDEAKNRINKIERCDTVDELLDAGIKPNDAYLIKINPKLSRKLEAKYKIYKLGEKYGDPIYVGRIHEFGEYDLSERRITKLGEDFLSKYEIDNINANNIKDGNKTYFFGVNVSEEQCNLIARTKINSGIIKNIISETDNERVIADCIDEICKRMNSPTIYKVLNYKTDIIKQLENNGFEKSNEITNKLSEISDESVYVYGGEYNPSEVISMKNVFIDKIRSWKRQMDNALSQDKTELVDFECNINSVLSGFHIKMEDELIDKYVDCISDFVDMIENRKKIETLVCAECESPITPLVEYKDEVVSECEDGEDIKEYILCCDKCNSDLISFDDESILLSTIQELIKSVCPGEKLSWFKNNELKLEYRKNDGTFCNMLMAVVGEIELSSVKCECCDETVKSNEFVKKIKLDKTRYDVYHSKCGCRIGENIHPSVYEAIKEKIP